MTIKCVMTYEERGVNNPNHSQSGETEYFFDFWEAVAHAGRGVAWDDKMTSYEYISEQTGEEVTKQVFDAAKGATRWAQGNYSEGNGVVC